MIFLERNTHIETDKGTLWEVFSIIASNAEIPEGWHKINVHEDWRIRKVTGEIL